MTSLCESTLHFRGHPYKVASIGRGDHPSYHGFTVDEVETRDALWGIMPGDYVIDAGACYGSYTLTALAAGAERAWAWSPQSHGVLSEAEVLRESLRLNGWQDRAEVYDTGLYSQKGWLICYNQMYFQNKPGPEDYKEPEGTNTVSDLIEVDTLDAWYAGLDSSLKAKMRRGRVWLKMDVESAELEVVKGGAGTILDLRPIIINENHTCMVPGIDIAFRDLLKDRCGYDEIRNVPYHSRSHSLFMRPA
jgi:FkbM family methyltransferase